MFTTNHFIWMGVCAAFIGILLFISLKFKFSFKTAALVMSAIAFMSEACKIITHIEETEKGGVLMPTALPFHLCSILIFIIFYVTFTKNEKRRGVLVSFCTPIALFGSILAILFATSGVSFVKPEPYQCFIYHAGLVWWALYLIITKQVDLGLRAYINNVRALSILLVVMIWVNSILSVYNTNFFFVVRPPAENLPILNLNRGWLVYFITLVLAGLILVTLTHLPGIIKDVKRIKAEKKNEK